MQFNEICSIGVFALTEKTKKELQNYSTNTIKLFDDITVENHDTISKIGESDCLLISLLTPINKYIIDRCQNLKFIGLAGTHPTQIDLEYTTQRGISVTTVDGYCDYETAEFVIAQLLSFYRLPHISTGIKPRSLHKKRVGIIGLGRVGKKLANMCLSMGMKVTYYNRNQRNNPEERAIDPLPLETLLGDSDIISLHTPANQMILTAELFPLIRKGTILVNTCLGQTMDQQALCEWLKTKDNTLILDTVSALYYPGLDSFENVIVAPYFAYDTQESHESLNTLLVQNIHDYLVGLRKIG